MQLRARFGLLLSVSCLVLSGTTGCESLQRKLIRKRKTPEARPAPVVQFEDYSQTVTPLERYRKHALMLDYWNAQLLDELAGTTPNPKRFRQASAQSLEELHALQRLLQPDRAAVVEPILAERRRLDQQLQTGPYHPVNLTSIRSAVDAQTRQIHRQMSWRDVQDHLKPKDAAP